MTTEQKGSASVLAGLMMVLGLILARDSLPVLSFLFGEAKEFWSIPMLGHTVLAALVGALLPSWLPHALPPKWPAHRTKRVTRLAGVAVASVALFSQYPSPAGAMFALFAGSLAYMLWTMMAGTFYRLFPHAMPSSLVDRAAPAPTPQDGDTDA